MEIGRGYSRSAAAGPRVGGPWVKEMEGWIGMPVEGCAMRGVWGWFWTLQWINT